MKVVFICSSGLLLAMTLFSLHADAAVVQAADSPYGQISSSGVVPIEECRCHAPPQCDQRAPELRLTCPNGNAVNSCGCIENCQCAGCPLVDETLSCPNGRRTDSNGCPANECEPCICPANECQFFLAPEMRYECPNGDVVDSCGCVESSCQCADCPFVNRSLSCPNGRLEDENGCPLNECKPCICPANECQFFLAPEMRYECPNGNVVDDCGCVESSCQCEGCPAVNTSLSCPNGRKTDENGCPLNECEPCICPANDCGFSPVAGLRYNCPNGNVLDSCGCVKSCQCEGCPAVDMTLSCPNGRRTDSNGCPLNECVPCICPANECGFFLAPNQRYECPNGNIEDHCGCVTSCQCAGCPLINEIMDCDFGRKTDSNGCPLNECNPPPGVVEKAGSCPRYGAWGTKTCVNDQDCPGAQKCCRIYSRKICNQGGAY